MPLRPKPQRERRRWRETRRRLVYICLVDRCAGLSSAVKSAHARKATGGCSFTGCEVVQIADNMPLHLLSAPTLERLGAQANDLGIDLEIGTRGIDPAHLQAYVSIARRLRAKLVRTLLDGADHKPSTGEAIAMLREVVPSFEDAGVTLAIENHDRFPARTLAAIIEELNRSAVGVCLDTANSLGCGEGITEVLDALAKYVVNLHVKDFTIARLPHNKGFIIEGTPAGKGLLDIPLLLRRLQELGADVNAIVELWPAPQNDIEASVAKEQQWADESVGYLRRLI